MIEDEFDNLDDNFYDDNVCNKKFHEFLVEQYEPNIVENIEKLINGVCKEHDISSLDNLVFVIDDFLDGYEIDSGKISYNYRRFKRIKKILMAYGYQFESYSNKKTDKSERKNSSKSVKDYKIKKNILINPNSVSGSDWKRIFTSPDITIDSYKIYLRLQGYKEKDICQYLTAIIEIAKNTEGQIDIESFHGLYKNALKKFSEFLDMRKAVMEEGKDVSSFFSEQSKSQIERKFSDRNKEIEKKDKSNTSKPPKFILHKKNKTR